MKKFLLLGVSLFSLFLVGCGVKYDEEVYQSCLNKAYAYFDFQWDYTGSISKPVFYEEREGYTRIKLDTDFKIAEDVEDGGKHAFFCQMSGTQFIDGFDILAYYKGEDLDHTIESMLDGGGFGYLLDDL